MKPIVLIITVLFSALTTAQNVSIDRPSISVYGIHHYTAEVISYKVTASLSLHEAQYGSDSKINLQELKNDFFLMLSEQGIDTSKLVEKEMEYMLTGRKGEGTSLTFVTSKEDEFKKFLGISFPGIYFDINYVKYELQETSRVKIVKEVLANAKEKAAKIARGMNKDLGEIVLVSEVEPLPDENNWSYHFQDPRYRVFVVFAIE